MAIPATASHSAPRPSGVGGLETWARPGGRETDRTWARPLEAARDKTLDLYTLKSQVTYHSASTSGMLEQPLAILCFWLVKMNVIFEFLDRIYIDDLLQHFCRLSGPDSPTNKPDTEQRR